MIIRDAKFVISNSQVKGCPAPKLPEYAFIGRSNVGKSSLINMLVNQKGLAKTSARPGKTQLINHFIINQTWYLVDLPGYGYARASKDKREGFSSLITSYIGGRTNLQVLFVLIDIRLEMQKTDEQFLLWLGQNQIPFVIIFTKSDKLGKTAVQSHVAAYKKQIMRYWEAMPPYFISSAETGLGRDEILNYIESLNAQFSEP